MKEALQDERSLEEVAKVEELFTEIAKEGKAVYGWKEVNDAAGQGAIETLLVTDDCITKKREEGKGKSCIDS